MKRLLGFFFFLCSLRVSAQEKTLDYFLQQAVQNSPFLAENKNQIESLKYDSLHIHSLYKPQVSFNSSNMYAPVVNGFGYDNIITNGGAFSALAGTNITMVGKQNLGNQFANVNLQKQSLQVEGKLSERDLKQNISSQYITIYGEQQMLLNTKDVMNVLGKEEIMLKKLAEQGVYHETDYLSFLVNYKQQELAYSEKKLQVKNDLALLNYYCGIVDTTFCELTKPSFEKKNALQPDQTFTLKKYAIDSLILKNNYEQIKFNYKPRVNLFGDAGYLSSLAYQAQKNFGASAGFNINIPIYDGRQRYLRYEKIKLSENTRVNYMQFFKKQYSQQVLQLQQQISSTEKLMNDAQKQLSLSDALVQANRKLLLTGEVKMIGYILAITNYITAQNTVLQLQISEFQFINQFNYLNY